VYSISKKGLEFIGEFEGFRGKAYLCPAGYPTIGFGHVIKDNEYLTILTEEEALLLLKKDLKYIEAILNKLIKVNLSETQYIALCSLAYNIGCGAFQRSSLRQKVNREEFEEVPLEFLKWVRVRGRILPGLVKRRIAEAELFSSKIDSFIY
jgi:lysozyme